MTDKRGWSAGEEPKWTPVEIPRPLFRDADEKRAIEAVIASGRLPGESLEEFMARAVEAGKESLKTPYRAPYREPGSDDE